MRRRGNCGGFWGRWGMPDYRTMLAQLPAEWSVQRIEEIGSVVSGGTPSRDVPAYWNGRVAWVTPGELTRLDSKHIYTTNERISEAGVANSGATLLPPGSLLVTTRATLGAAAINQTPIATNQGFKSVVFRNGHISDYYYHWTRKLKVELERRASGTTFAEISGSEFKSIEVPVPPAAEQAAIACILDTLDTQIEQTKALIAKLEQVKEGLLDDLLTRGVDENGELRPSAEEAPDQFGAFESGVLPRTWAVIPLGDCAEIVSGITLGSKPAQSTGVLVPYLRVANVQDGRIDLTDLKYIRVSPAELQLLRLQPGDVLMNEGGDFDKLGRGAVWCGQVSDCIHQNHVFRVRTDSSRLHPEFLAAYAASQAGKRFFVRASKQSTNLASINSTQLKAMPVPVAPMAEQQMIVEKIRSMNDAIRLQQEASDTLALFKSGLMDDLLTGRVRVTPLLDPAPTEAS